MQRHRQDDRSDSQQAGTAGERGPILNNVQKIDTGIALKQNCDYTATTHRNTIATASGFRVNLLV
jgi:hypothetical protein